MNPYIYIYIYIYIWENQHNKENKNNVFLKNDTTCHICHWIPQRVTNDHLILKISIHNGFFEKTL
jgi:hypothetical protein